MKKKFTNSKRKNKIENSKNFIFNMINSQATICILIFCGFFSLSKVNNSKFNKLKLFLKNNISESAKKEDLLKIYKSGEKFLIDFKNSFKKDFKNNQNSKKYEQINLEDENYEDQLLINDYFEKSSLIEENINIVKDRISENNNDSEELKEEIKKEINKEEWIFPVKNYIITSDFGDRMNPITNKYEFHNGIDIFSEDKRIFAPTKAIVKEIGFNEFNGNYLILETKNNFKIKYLHLEKIFVKKNQVIKRGKKIALMGNTGLSTNTHLHFSILKNEKYLNPLNFNFKRWLNY